MIVGDGYCKDGRSAAAFVIQQHHQREPKQEIRNHHALTVPGEPEDQSSYRGELGSILAGIVYTNEILKEQDITSGKCFFLCDSKGALDASFGWRTPNSTWTCYDIVSMIRFHIRQSNIKWVPKI